MLVHVVVEQFGVHHVAVAEQEQTVAGAQFGKCFGVLWRKIGHHGVPTVENLLVGEVALQNAPYLTAEIPGAYQPLLIDFCKSLFAHLLVRLFHGGDAMAAESVVHQLKVEGYDGTAKVEDYIFYHNLLFVKNL